MRNGRPLDADVVTLPVVDRGRVAEEDIDFNGHMNVNVYLRVLTTTTIRGLTPAGLGYDYPEAYAHGLFSVDHHAQYLSELRLGDEYTTHVRLVGASDRGVHTIAYLRDVRGTRISATLESMLLNVGHESRRVGSFPEEIRQRLAGELDKASALVWSPVVCGAIQLPGKAQRPARSHLRDR
jgi:acyl-CoA thioester hydrolase